MSSWLYLIIWCVHHNIQEFNTWVYSSSHEFMISLHDLKNSSNNIFFYIFSVYLSNLFYLHLVFVKYFISKVKLSLSIHIIKYKSSTMKHTHIFSWSILSFDITNIVYYFLPIILEYLKEIIKHDKIYMLRVKTFRNLKYYTNIIQKIKFFNKNSHT